MCGKVIISRNHLFTQQLCAKIRCARKFSHLYQGKKIIQFTFILTLSNALSNLVLLKFRVLCLVDRNYQCLEKVYISTSEQGYYRASLVRTTYSVLKRSAHQHGTLYFGTISIRKVFTGSYTIRVSTYIYTESFLNDYYFQTPSVQPPCSVVLLNNL